MDRITQTSAQIDTRPHIVVPLGRPRSGKTTLLRWMIERGVIKRTRPLKLIDADPYNDTLRQRYPEAESPGSTDLDERRVWLETALRAQRQSAQDGNPYDAYWDIGGGDLLISHLAHEIGVTPTLSRAGINLIAFYVLTPTLSDLDYFKALDATGFRPQRLGLICNGGAPNGGRKTWSDFEPLLSDPFVTDLMKHGAVPLYMPPVVVDEFEPVWQTGIFPARDARTYLNDSMYETRLSEWLDALGWFV